MVNFIVVSYYPGDFNEMNCPNNWFKTFDEKEEALDYFHTETNRFNVKQIFDCRNGIAQEFLDDWCYPDKYDESGAEAAGYCWDEEIEEFVRLQHANW